MSAFGLLSEPIRKYIRDQRWESLRKIQEAAIPSILGTDLNYVIISRTASGKTEAAFLPILSKVNFREEGVKVLYISPLIALINDQFLRVEKLCEHLDVKVTKWHGEASKAQKDHLVKNPQGVVLITPESLEAMFVNKPYHVRHLFASLDYVVIDEIHSFLGSDRGVQLKSLLSRLQEVNRSRFSIVGLSATVSDANLYAELKEFLGNAGNTKIIRDNTPKPINAIFRYFHDDKEELPLNLLKDLYIRTRDSKVLVFPNARGRVEEVAVKLKKISERVGGHQNYFSHHSSVDKEVREYVEFFAKNASLQNFCISCTSTLELGIDIGNVDEVVQIDATNSIASLIQRVGRSGRREGKASNLYLYSTDRWSLLQSLACWLLYSEQYIEPIEVIGKPYDVLLHQILSMVKGSSGLYLQELLGKIAGNPTFSHISEEETKQIIDHLQEIDFLEKLGHEYILGVEGEKVVNSKDFYSVFHTPVFLKVSSQGVKIGELPLSPQIREDENIYLSAKIWKIKYVDFETRKIEVVPAKDGKKPLFLGDAADTAHRIREKMIEILYSHAEYDFLDEEGRLILKEMRKEFSVFAVKDRASERPLLSGNGNLEFYSFAGSKINKTICFLLDYAEVNYRHHDNSSVFICGHTETQPFEKLIALHLTEDQINEKLHEDLKRNPALINLSKWGSYLSLKFQVEILKTKSYDFEGCFKFLEKMQFVQNINEAAEI
ncbi:ATP-dependent Lhr-like helicase [Chryseobacterium sp. SORGH_AS 447]|uniref:DEAD/DEAH box helicase n=1 Tax=Chryseobacterium sp. SORGH_AS_0447 TaxID=3041769 RepID=UPI0027815052|nr:DEAD/DEAH box helicase [Chryseobacterium sp. SORGH_AS_0447]MDQ1162403.1 ATP-dependent Lhr-like helicase [Chryseobacterium sp. SORGH_AS_0447]